MKRQTVVLIWAAALLLLVATCFGIYYVWNDWSTDRTKNEAIEVFSCISTDIESYTVSDKNGRYTLEKDDGIWYIEDDRNAALDQAAVEKLVAAASKITANGSISRKDLAAFDTSEIKTVSLDIDNGKDVEIRFLGTSKNLCAFKIIGDRKTYVMYETARDILAPSIDSLRITAVFPQLAKSDTLPERYSFTDYEGNETKIRLKTGGELVKSKENRYTMEKPYRREVDDELFEQQIAIKIPVLKAQSFVKNPSSDKAVYGLDKESRAELRFNWDGADEALYLGKDEGGAVFAMREGYPDVFLINTSLLEFLHMEPFFILEGGLLKAKADDIIRVKLIKGADSYDITASGKNEETRQFFVNGKTASKAVFEDIIDELEDISFRNELDSVPENTRDIEITISYSGAAGSQRISLVKSGEKAYAVFLDGKAEFEVSSEDIDELIKELKEAINNPMRMD